MNTEQNYRAGHSHANTNEPKAQVFAQTRLNEFVRDFCTAKANGPSLCTKAINSLRVGWLSGAEADSEELPNTFALVDFLLQIADVASELGLADEQEASDAIPVNQLAHSVPLNSLESENPKQCYKIAELRSWINSLQRTILLLRVATKNGGELISYQRQLIEALREQIGLYEESRHLTSELLAKYGHKAPFAE